MFSRMFYEIGEDNIFYHVTWLTFMHLYCTTLLYKLYCCLQEMAQTIINHIIDLPMSIFTGYLSTNVMDYKFISNQIMLKVINGSQVWPKDRFKYLAFRQSFVKLTAPLFRHHIHQAITCFSIPPLTRILLWRLNGGWWNRVIVRC